MPFEDGMKRAIVITVLVLFTLFIGYRAWPIVSSAQLGAAIQRGDRQAVNDRIDFLALRKALGRQIARAYLEESGRGGELGGAGRAAAIAAGATAAEAFLEQVLTPDNVIAFLKDGRIAKVPGMERPLSLDARLPPFADLIRSDLLRVFLISYFDGLTRFVVIADDPATAGTRYGLVFALGGLHWRLVELDLPRALRFELARELMDREKKPK